MSQILVETTQVQTNQWSERKSLREERRRPVKPGGLDPPSAGVPGGAEPSGEYLE